MKETEVDLELDDDSLEKIQALVKISGKTVEEEAADLLNKGLTNMENEEK